MFIQILKIILVRMGMEMSGLILRRLGETNPLELKSIILTITLGDILILTGAFTEAFTEVFTIPFTIPFGVIVPFIMEVLCIRIGA
tara:strand:+ start:266 stop:523 length:258 start_codon:yes stop_codon:yes gene_type:complete